MLPFFTKYFFDYNSKLNAVNIYIYISNEIFILLLLSVIAKVIIIYKEA